MVRFFEGKLFPPLTKRALPGAQSHQEACAGSVQVVQQGPFFADPGAPVYVITGGGGENLWQPIETNQPFTMFRQRVHHVTKITINGNVLTIQPFDENGAAIDINGAAAGTASTITKTTAVRFRRGDSNLDNSVDLSDAIFSLSALFQGGSQPHCLDAADANDDEALDLTDAVFTVRFLFVGGSAPPAPGPTGCGPDPNGTGLNCLDYPTCTECDCVDTEDNDADSLVDCDDDDCAC